MPLLRLAYATQFLIALIAVFVLWSQVGGQSHLDYMAWPWKLLLGGGAAFSVVKATASAVDGARAWNAKTLRWLGILLVLLIGCGLASYYVHLYAEPEDDQQDDTAMLTVAPRFQAGLVPPKPVEHARSETAGIGGAGAHVTGMWDQPENGTGVGLG
jgi:hypothetical protein